MTMSAATPKPSRAGNWPPRSSAVSKSCVQRTWPSTSVFSVVSPSILGSTDAAQLPTDERVERFANGGDPALAALYHQYGRYLLISSSRPGFAAGQPAGHLERPDGPAVGKQIHDQHQHRNELLAQRGQCVARMRGTTGRHAVRSGADRCAPGQGNVRRARLGGAPQHRPVAADRAHRWRAVGLVADGWRMAAAAIVGPLGLRPR